MFIAVLWFLLFFFETKSCDVFLASLVLNNTVLTGLELEEILLQSPEFWLYRPVLSPLAFVG